MKAQSAIWLVLSRRKLRIKIFKGRRSALKGSAQLPEKLDHDDGRIEEVDRVLEENEFVQVGLVGPVDHSEELDYLEPDVSSGGEKQSCSSKDYSDWV